MGPSTTRIRGFSSNFHVYRSRGPAGSPRAAALPSSGSSGDFLGVQEASDRVARLGTASKPILDAVGVQLDFRRGLQRVVRSHDFDSSAVAGFAFIQHHNAVKRVLFLADPSQTDCQHGDFLLWEIIASSARLRYP